MAKERGGDMAPLAIGRETEAVIECGLRRAGDATREGGEVSTDG